MQALPELSQLNLAGARITDNGLEHLKQIKNLQVLELNGTPITDAGLIRLQQLKALVRLDLSGTKVTAAGIKALQAALPRCEITSSFGTVQPEPLPPIKGGEPLSTLALVQRPAVIKGVRSWSVEIIQR